MKNVTARFAPALAAALAVLSAGGEVVALGSVGYGVATIGQSVKIIAPTGIYAGISVFSSDGIAVARSGIKVLLRGLTPPGTSDLAPTRSSRAEAARCTPTRTASTCRRSGKRDAVAAVLAC